MFKSAVYSLSIKHGRFNKRVNTFVTIIKRIDFDHYISGNLRKCELLMT